MQNISDSILRLLGNLDKIPVDSQNIRSRWSRVTQSSSFQISIKHKDELTAKFSDLNWKFAEKYKLKWELGSYSYY
ncbi:MAG: hypothetical protein BRC41_13980 [Cyanobacteria bacterium QH_9_48_43]|nr:MAG: hypothetical protein BRC41_13980 [Cyanobacteria bacterium QH_9_48_43]